MLTQISMAVSTEKIALSSNIVVSVINKLRCNWIEHGGGEHGMQVTTRPGLYPGELQVVFSIHNSRKGCDYAARD